MIVLLFRVVFLYALPLFKVYETLLDSTNIIVVCSQVGIGRAVLLSVSGTTQSDTIDAVQNLCFWLIVVYCAVWSLYRRRSSLVFRLGRRSSLVFRLGRRYGSSFSWDGVHRSSPLLLSAQRSLLVSRWRSSLISFRLDLAFIARSISVSTWRACFICACIGRCRHLVGRWIMLLLLHAL